MIQVYNFCITFTANYILIIKIRVMNNLLDDLKRYFKNTCDNQIIKDWAESESLNLIGPSVDEFIKETEFFFKLEQDKLTNRQLSSFLNIRQPEVTFGFLI